LDAYMSEHAEKKAVAPERQRYAVIHLKQHLGDADLRDIDIRRCREYGDLRREEDGAANSTIRRELNVLSAAANHGHRWRKFGIDQLPQVELPDIGESEKVQWFTKAQMRQLFEIHPPTTWFGCFLPIAYYTAGRRDSIERLLKAQVDRELGCVHLARPKERQTKKRRPTVPLYPEMRPAVDWLFEHSGTPYLFARDRDFYKPFVKSCEALQLQGNPHMLRHSRATHMLQDGESIYKVAKLLGDSVATVERVYGHVSVDFLSTHSNVGAMSPATETTPKRNAGMFRAVGDYPTDA
jgi:integrase